MLEKKRYSIGEFARLISVSIKTLERWDETGKLTAYRTPGGSRFYTEEQRVNFWSQPSKEPSAEVYVKLRSINQVLLTQEQIDSLKQFGKQVGIQIELMNTQNFRGHPQSRLKSASKAAKI